MPPLKKFRFEYFDTLLCVVANVTIEAYCGDFAREKALNHFLRTSEPDSIVHEFSEVRFVSMAQPIPKF